MRAKGFQSGWPGARASAAGHIENFVAYGKLIDLSS
jgi:hypothetical protein